MSVQSTRRRSDRPAAARCRRAVLEALEPRQLLAGATLLADLNTSTASASPGNFAVTADGTVYFSANDGARGYELHRSDGTAGGTRIVREINPGPGNGTLFDSYDFPGTVAAVGNTVYFVGTDPAGGQELWKTDGTEGGTVRVMDINAGTASSSPRRLTAVGGLVYFTASSLVGAGPQLWRTDGTEAGTRAVTTTGSVGSGPVVPIGDGTKVLFRANMDAAADELWVTDGTAAGTTRLTDINTAGNSGPSHLTAVDGAVYFTATQGTAGGTTPVGLYRTDGTATGTVRLASYASGSAPTDLIGSGSKLYYFTVANLWVTTGTAAPTQVTTRAFRGLNTGPAASGATAGALVDSIYFLADGIDGAGGELWRSNGTDAGTVRVTDLNSETSSLATAITPVGDGSGSVYFAAMPAGGSKDRALYRTDGTAAGTVALTSAADAVVVPPQGSANTGGPRRNVPLPVGANGRVFFAATTPAAGTELWSSTGTAGGAGMVKDINADTVASSPARGAVLDGKLLFAATAGATGTELYATDGTPGGTALLKEIYPGPAGTSPAGVPIGSGNPSQLVRAGGYVYFSAADPAGGDELWRTDGTAGGTVRVKDIYGGTEGSFPLHLTAVGDVVYFSAKDAAGDRELWRTDGTDAGTRRVKDIRPGSTSSAPAHLTAFGGAVYFAADDGATGTELWRTDGTDAGTVLVRDVYAGLAWSTPANLTVVGPTLYFSATTAAAGNELWKTDGTAAGTVLVRDVYAGSGHAYPARMVNLNGTLLFAADTADGGQELYRSDGTAGGTVLVKDIYPGFGSSSLNNLTVSGSRLFFTATDGTHGGELWASDGTAGGTYMVADVNRNPGATSYPGGLQAVDGGRIVFGTSETVNGGLLWVSDGTTGGTTQLGRVRAAGVPSQATFPTAVGVLPGGVAVFGMDDGATGAEPWAVSVPPLAAPVASAGGPYAVDEGQPVTLSAAGSTGSIDRYEWDLDYDGTTFVAEVAGVTINLPAYDGPLTRTVAVRVTGPAGTSTATATVTVANLPPTVDLGPDRTGNEGAAVFVPAALSDPSWNTPRGITGGDRVTFAWAATDAGGTVVASGTGPQQGATFTPPDDGVYTVRFTATDDDGASATDTALVTVANVAPTITLTGAAAVDEGATYTLNVAVADPGADTVSSVRVDWGDGSVQTFPGRPASVTHAYDDGPGVRPVSVTVTDEDGSYVDAVNGPAAGSPVASFGTNGRAATPVGSNTADIVEAVLAQPDGRIVAVGWANDGNNPKFALARFTAAGALDPTFGAGGKVLTDFPDVSGVFARDAALQPDGKIVAVGYNYFDYVVVARYNPDGSLDATFSGDGMLATKFGTGDNAGLAVRVDAAGRIVVGGHHAYGDFAVMRLLPDGAADPSFGGGDGIVTTNVGGTDQAHDMALLPDGRIVLGGYAAAATGTGNDLAMAVYRPDGTLDPAFSDDGIARADVGGLNEYGEAIAVDAQGRILVGGTGYLSGADGHWVVARFNPDGSRDAAFGGGGTAAGIRENPSGSNDIVQSIRHDAAGRVIVGGLFGVGPGVVRYRPDGTRDSSFGQNGLAQPVGGQQLNAVAFAADGNLLTGGVGNSDFLVTKLQAVGRHEVAVRNVAPAATWSGPTSAGEGQPVTLTLVGTDASAADAAALRYSFDFNNDGDFADPGDVADAASATATYTFPSAGTYTVRGRVADKDGGQAESTTTVTVAAEPPPAVQAVVVDDGTAQRSMVRRLTVTFARRVVAEAGAFAVAGRNGAGGGTAVSAANPSGDGVTWVLTFAGTGVVAGSLPDGVYDLTVVGAKVRGGTAAGPAMTADHTLAFHRLFGDANNSRSVNNADYLLFRNAFGKPSTDPGYDPAFDLDGNGTVNNADYLQFRARFGKALEY